MIQKRNNKKGLYFLTLLGVFAFFAVKISNKIHVESKATEIKVVSTEECTNCGGVESKVTEEKILPEEQNSIKVTVLPASETVDITDSVLGVLDVVRGKTAWSCEDYNVANHVASDTILCSNGTGSINYEGGSAENDEIRVAKDAEIQLTEVTYPLAYWLGKYTYDNSTKTITTRTSEYRSSGEQINEAYQSRALAPQEAETFRKNIDGTVRQKFTVEGTVSADPEITEIHEAGKYVVRNASHDPKCNCVDKVAVSDFNVGKSNYISSDKDDGLYMRQQIPGGDKYDESPVDGCIKEGEDFKSIDYGLKHACWDIVAKIKGIFKNPFSRAQWNACNGIKCDENDEDCEEGERTDNCIKPEDIGVTMSSIFGDPYECETEGCATAAMTYVHKATLSPEQASNKKIVSGESEESLMHFVATPCRAMVVETRLEIDVKCIWDDSPTMLNYFLNKTDSAPGQDFPKNFDTYWSSTEEDIKKSAEYYKL